MNELTVTNAQLPTTLEDLSKFALIGREKLTAVRAEISAIKKLGLAKEVHAQKLKEAQDIAELVTRAEMRVGEMLSEIPKATPNNNPFHEKGSGEHFVKQKSESVREIGFTEMQAKRLQKMAAHPEIVEAAIAEARESNDIVSRAFVLGKIDEARKPHIANNSGNNEWYTPPEYIEAARELMGGIDLDPASCEIANRVVKAARFFTAEDDGLLQAWNGNVWMNPPYAADLIGKFCDKLADEFMGGNVPQAVVLVNNATETTWFNTLIECAAAVVFPSSRVKFYMPDGKTGAPLQGQAVVYLGDMPLMFLERFRRFGWGARLNE